MNAVPLYTKNELRKMRKSNLLFSVIAAVIMVSALAACIVICFFVTPGNRRTLLPVVWLIFIPAGWISITFLTFFITPGRAVIRHIEGVIDETPEKYTGTFSSDFSVFAIPKSIRACKVTVTAADGADSLMLCANFIKDLPELCDITALYAVGSYIVGYEVRNA